MTTFSKKLRKIAQHGSLSDLRQLMTEVVSVEWSDHQKCGDQISHLLARNGKIEMMDTLHKQWGLPLGSVSKDGKTPLHEAALCNQIAIIKYLLSCGVAVDPLKHAGWTPLMLACSKAHLEAVKMLVNNGGNVLLLNKDEWNCFHIACRKDDMMLIRYLCSITVSPWKNKSRNGRTPLHTAALHGCSKVVRFLIYECNFKFDICDACGSTPFLDSVRSGNLSTVKIFVEHDHSCLADTNLIGLSCLHVAAEANCGEVIEYLSTTFSLNVNIAVTIKGICYGQTPLHFARKEHNDQAIKILLKLNADEQVTDAQGRKAKDLEMKWRI